MSASGIEDFEAADDATLLDGHGPRRAPGPAGRRARRGARSSRAACAAEAVAAGRLAMRDYLASRPVLAELDAIEPGDRASPPETGCALHVVHVSSGARRRRSWPRRAPAGWT